MTKDSRPTRHRRPGEGSVYRTSSGRWRGAVTWTEAGGEQHRRVVSGRTAEEARDKVDALRAELRLGTIGPSGRAVTVADYLAGWLERDRTHVRYSTWKGRELHVRAYLVPALGQRPLARLTAADVETALGRLVESGRPISDAEKRRGRTSAPVSPLTARHVRATLRVALAAAIRDGLVVRNVAADARPPYVPHRPVSYLSAPDVRRLLDGTVDEPYGPLLALAVSTGLRQGEILGLSWTDVELDAATITVRQSLALARGGGFALAQPKSARSRRTLLLPGRAVDALRRQRRLQATERLAAGSAWQRSELVFTDAIGRPLMPWTVSAAFRELRDRLDLPPVRFHDLRHSAATLLLAEGVPLAVVSEMLGHSGIAITAAHYAAIVPELRREAADAMDRALR